LKSLMPALSEAPLFLVVMDELLMRAWVVEASRNTSRKGSGLAGVDDVCWSRVELRILRDCSEAHCLAAASRLCTSGEDWCACCNEGNHGQSNAERSNSLTSSPVCGDMHIRVVGLVGFGRSVDGSDGVVHAACGMDYFSGWWSWDGLLGPL
jgi:hypothetical protein